LFQFIRPNAVLTASEFEAMGHRMIRWPVTSLRIADKTEAKLSATRARDGTHSQYCPKCKRAKFSDLIGLAEFEAPDASIVAALLHCSILDPLGEAAHSP
jgi:2-methylisocitrate lyase-like PEP mutase family enzyme